MFVSVRASTIGSPAFRFSMSLVRRDMQLKAMHSHYMYMYIIRWSFWFIKYVFTMT